MYNLNSFKSFMMANNLEGLLKLTHSHDNFYHYTQVDLMGVMSPRSRLLWKNKNDNATINCSHTKGVSCFQMY